MLKPRLENFWDDITGTYDYDAYYEILGDYEDNAYDEWRDDQIPDHIDIESEEPLKPTEGERL